MQHDLTSIREADERAPQPVRAGAALSEIEWKMHSLMITSGLVIGPIVVVLVVAAVLWFWLT